MEVDPERIVLTTSTSEGYSFVFRLLCNAGDELLVPKPSYPLFEFLADLQDVKLVPYPLIYDHGWQMDFPSLEKAVTARTRGVVVVHPNNPTGSYVQAGEVELLNSFCRAHGLAVIVDEVFLDYGITDSTGAVELRSTGQPGRLSRMFVCGESGCADVYAERAVEDCGIAADEGGVGGDERAAGIGGRGDGAAGGDCRHVSFDECAGSVGGAGAAGAEEEHSAAVAGAGDSRILPSWTGSLRGRRLASG